MFKTLLSLIFNEGLLLVCLIGFGFFYLEFFPVYWLALTAVSMIVLIIILPNFTGRFDKYDK
ncbi:Uncharacterised protein [Raoultella terrigena]|uniref:Uncharacterized protein n=1 Tax=Raoultella terrigena TaxID=577 RepID=A0A3P8M163_RAOTE|nr:Uncharacterised protein [Raoultella terrigena]